MHKLTTRCKSTIPTMKENSERFYHYTHTFSIPYSAHNLAPRVFNQKTSRISLKIIIQCCAYLNNDKMSQVVGLCKYGHIYFHSSVLCLFMCSVQLRWRSTVSTATYALSCVCLFMRYASVEVEEYSKQSSLCYYQRMFEAPFLAETKEYYLHVASKLVSKCVCVCVCVLVICKNNYDTIFVSTDHMAQKLISQIIQHPTHTFQNPHNFGR